MASPARQPAILNVDDNEACRYALTRILMHASFRVCEAATGSEALHLAATERPDLVLLDVNLPDMNGFEVCRRLKADPATAQIPVMHISASYAKPSDLTRGLEAGAETYLTEPVEPEVLIATIRAVLRTRAAEDEASRVAREWQSTFDSLCDGVAVVDVQGIIQRANAALCRAAGAAPHELPGRSCCDLWPAHAEALRATLARGLSVRGRQELEIRDGETIFRASFDAILGPGGKVSGAVYLVSDVTERKRLQDQFRESQKFETVGTLAAGVAHDFNNLLTSIMGNASLALMDAPQGVREHLEEVVHASQRAADLTAQLLAYSGKGRHYLQKISVERIILSMESLIRSSVPKKIRLTLSTGAGERYVMADAAQVQQLVLNLVSNAAEAIGEAAGSIHITTRATMLGGGELPEAPRGEYVCLEVRDTGCGMDEETKARIFDPFFSTKFTGRGLGLSAVQGIVRGHGGVLHVSSAPGQGTTFRVFLPVIEEPAAEKPTAEPRRQAKTSGTILVVDDEDTVQRVAKATLELRGYKVLLASNGQEGVEVFKQHAAEIAVVLLDLTMPVMDGEEALREMLRLRPDVKAIISTGYGNREAAARFANCPVVAFLQKPYTSRKLAEVLKVAIEGKHEA